MVIVKCIVLTAVVVAIVDGSVRVVAEIVTGKRYT